MQFGPLVNPQTIQKRFKQYRVQSRQQILNQIYSFNNTQIITSPIQQQISHAFQKILQNFQYDKTNQIINQIINIFNINLEQIKKLPVEDRKKLIRNKLVTQIQQLTKINKDQQFKNQLKLKNNTHFQWLGVNTKYQGLRPIFQQILLQKVKLFDHQLTKLTQNTDLVTNSTVGTLAQSNITQNKYIYSPNKNNINQKIKLIHSKTQHVLERNRVQSAIQKQFTNVKIRDKSQFLLSKWQKQHQQQFQAKKSEFRNNLKINNIPVLFQFVKKYTTTVKARDNIYRKWQNREKQGITPQQLRYLCATSLFLNHSLAQSQKKRIKNCVNKAGTTLIRKLQFNIAQKIIQTYHELMKKISDLRARFYEDLTLNRKQQQKQTQKQQKLKTKRQIKKQTFIKYKKMFQRIVNSEKMKLKLNKKIYKWIILFITNLKSKIKNQKTNNKNIPAVFNKLATNTMKTLQYKLKIKYPSAKIIKRQDQHSHRLKYNTYIPSQRFKYDQKFEKSIQNINKIKLDKRHKHIYHNQLTGGPKSKHPHIIVNVHRKQIFLSQPGIIRHIIAIQAKWRAVYYRKKYLSELQSIRQKQNSNFQYQKQSLKIIYPQYKKIDMKAIQNRLQRVNMKISHILKPYVRTVKKQINIYTNFSEIQLSVADLKIKHSRNGQVRLGQFRKMVQNNQYNLLKKSGIVVTSVQINENSLKNNANAMWYSVYHSNKQLVNKFLQGGGDPNSYDAQSNTCLHLAMKKGDLQIVFLLLDYGADLSRKNITKVTPLFYATNKMLKLLGLQQGVVFGEKDNNSLFFRRTVPSYETAYQQFHY